MRSIGVVTVGRSDYGIYIPILKRIQQESELQLQLFVGGMHLSDRFGMSVNLIKNDGFPIIDKVKMLVGNDRPQDIAQSIGQGVIGFSKAFVEHRPDILVVLGDRFEMYSAALAALPFNIPVAHIHGGEITKGAIDDSLRHSMTKLSHLHFVSTDVYAKRVIQLGEEPWRVVVSGAPSLDNLDTIQYLAQKELEEILDVDLNQPTLLVTFHPVTLERDQAEDQIDALIAALSQSGLPAIFTMPNADTNNRIITEKITAYVNQHPTSKMVDNLGSLRYFSLMKYVKAMVGNSSSGLIEAPSFKLPVVNIGIRQEGRVRATNVIDVPCVTESILHAINKAISSEFHEGLKDLENPYKKSNAAKTIVDKLKSVRIDSNFLTKTFFDL